MKVTETIDKVVLSKATQHTVLWAMGASFGALIVALVITLWPEGTYAPLYGPGYEKPQRVENEVVELGEAVHVLEVVKCNASQEPVITSSNVHWVRVNNGNQKTIFVRSGGGPLYPGCYAPRDFENSMPSSVTPGTWVIRGIETVTDNNRVQIIQWETEPFEVVEATDAE